MLSAKGCVLTALVLLVLSSVAKWLQSEGAFALLIFAGAFLMCALFAEK